MAVLPDGIRCLQTAHRLHKERAAVDIVPVRQMPDHAGPDHPVPEREAPVRPVDIAPVQKAALPEAEHIPGPEADRPVVAGAACHMVAEHNPVPVVVADTAALPEVQHVPGRQEPALTLGAVQEQEQMPGAVPEQVPLRDEVTALRGAGSCGAAFSACASSTSALANANLPADEDERCFTAASAAARCWRNRSANASSCAARAGAGLVSV